MLTITIILNASALITLGVLWSIMNPRAGTTTRQGAAATAGPFATLRTRVMSIVAPSEASGALRAPTHPLVETMNVRHDRIIGGLRQLAEAEHHTGPDAINVAWDDIIAEVRGTCTAVLNFDAVTEAQSAAVANLAAQYLDLAIWMDTTHPDAQRTADDTLVVSHEWQSSIMESTAPLWAALRALSREAYSIAAADRATRAG